MQFFDWIAFLGDCLHIVFYIFFLRMKNSAKDINHAELLLLLLHIINAKSFGFFMMASKACFLED